MKRLSFEINEVSDISALKNLTERGRLHFGENEIEDISSLVENDGFGAGDYIYMKDNYLELTEGSEDMENISTLIDRGVDVSYEPQN